MKIASVCIKDIQRVINKEMSIKEYMSKHKLLCDVVDKEYSSCASVQKKQPRRYEEIRKK